MQSDPKPKIQLFSLPLDRPNDKFDSFSDKYMNLFKRSLDQKKTKRSNTISCQNSPKNISISKIVYLKPKKKEKRKKQCLSIQSSNISPMDLLSQRRSLIKDLVNQKISDNQAYIQKRKQSLPPRCKTLDARQNQTVSRASPLNLRYFQKQISIIDKKSNKFFKKSTTLDQQTYLLPPITNKNQLKQLNSFNSYRDFQNSFGYKEYLTKQLETSLILQNKITSFSKNKINNDKRIFSKLESMKLAIQQLSKQCRDWRTLKIDNSHKNKNLPSETNNLKDRTKSKQIIKRISKSFLYSDIKRQNFKSQAQKLINDQKVDKFEPWNNKQENFGFNVTNYFLNPQNHKIQNIVRIKK